MNNRGKGLRLRALLSLDAIEWIIWVDDGDLMLHGKARENGLRGDVTRRWNHLKLFDRNLIYYLLGLSLLILIFHQNIENWWKYGAFQIGFILILFIVMPWLDHQEHSLLRFLRYWYILFSFPLLYWHVGLFIHLIFPQEFDPFIIQIDRWLFGALPNLWVQAYENQTLTEVMQIAYGTYWVTIPLGGAVFYFDKQYRLYELLLYYVTIIFFICSTMFILFPVAGPRFYLADQIRVTYRGLLIGNYLRSFVNEVAFRGGAFPSLHVGVAVMILVFMWKFRRKTAIFVFLPLVIALSLSTIYGQYHYVTDALVGIMIGLVMGFLASKRTGKITTLKGNVVATYCPDR